MQPEVAVIMCGKDNRFGHPHSEVLEALAVREIDVYRTDLHGHIVITTDEADYWIEVDTEDETRAPPEEVAVDTEGLININTASHVDL